MTIQPTFDLLYEHKQNPTLLISAERNNQQVFLINSFLKKKERKRKVKGKYFASSQLPATGSPGNHQAFGEVQSHPAQPRSHQPAPAQSKEKQLF